MSTPRAAIVHGKAFLFTDYGYAMAVHKFGQAAVDALPKFGPRSKHNGKPKGIVTFRKVARGGWVKLEQRVENRVGQIITAELRELAPFGHDPESGACVASWDQLDAEHAKGAAYRLAKQLEDRMAERAEWFAELVSTIGITEAVNKCAARAARLAAEGL